MSRILDIPCAKEQGMETGNEEVQDKGRERHGEDERGDDQQGDDRDDRGHHHHPIPPPHKVHPPRPFGV